MTLTSVGVIGYDPFRPCRFVKRMALDVRNGLYLFSLPASEYPRMLWFSVPGVRADQVTLVVLRTATPIGSSGPTCARTAIAKIGFAA